MRLTPLRRGMTLLELLVAAAIAGVLSLAATSLLRHAGRAAANRAATARAESVAHEAVAVAGAVIEPALSAAVLGDTAVDVVSLVTDLVPCEDGSAARLGPADATPAEGDRWIVLERTQAAGTDSLTWRPTAPMRLLSIGQRCGALDTLRPLARVTTRTRLVPYRASDASWILGLRRCIDRCEAAQPVAGPIRAPSDFGWRVRAVPCGIEVGVRPVGVTAVRHRVARRC